MTRKTAIFVSLAGLAAAIALFSLGRLLSSPPPRPSSPPEMAFAPPAKLLADADQAASPELIPAVRPAPAASTDPAESFGEEGVPAAPSPAGEARDEGAVHDHRKRSMPLRLDPGPAELARLFQADPAEATVVLRGFDGEDLRLLVRASQPHNDRAGALTGVVEGVDASFFSLAYAGTAEAGSIHLPSRQQVLELHPGPDGRLYVSEVDLDALGECGTCPPPEPERALPVPVP